MLGACIYYRYRYHISNMNNSIITNYPELEPSGLWKPVHRDQSQVVGGITVDFIPHRESESNQTSDIQALATYPKPK